MTLIDVHTVVSRSYWYLLVVINVFMALIGSRSLKTERFDWLFRFYANSAGESTSTHCKIFILVFVVCKHLETQQKRFYNSIKDAHYSKI
jgi:hypothetical protein